MKLILLTLTSALLYSAAFLPGAGHSGLVWVALVPWWVALRGVGAWRGFALGMLFGVAASVGIGGFLPTMLTDFFDTTPLWGWLGFAGIAVFLVGGFYAAFGAWLGWLSRRAPVPPWLVALAFMTCEFVRGEFPLPSPWALSAYSQASVPVIAQASDLAGPYGLGALVGLSNALIAGLLRRPAHDSRIARPLLAGTAVFACVLLYGSLRLSQTFGPDPSVEVALVQSMPLAELDAQRPELDDEERRAATLAHHIELSDRAARTSPTLIAWPEFSLDFSLREAIPATGALLRHARATGADLLVGGPDFLPARRGTAAYNSVFLVRGGHLSARYAKAQLMPFSESNPLRALVSIGDDRYSAGPPGSPLETAAGPVGVLLCSEVLLPGYVRDLVQRGARILVNPSNDAWFQSRAAARHQLAVASLRAIEARRPLLRPAAGGFTSIIDAHGRATARSSYRDPQIIHASVSPARESSPYHRFGDIGPIGAAAGAFAWTLVLARRRP